MSSDTPANLAIRFAGARAALNGEHPLTCPYLTGRHEDKSEWLLGYSFAQKLSDIDRQRMKLALMEHEQAAAATPTRSPST